MIERFGLAFRLFGGSDAFLTARAGSEVLAHTPFYGFIGAERTLPP
jgi:hypothetical protein